MTQTLSTNELTWLHGESCSLFTKARELQNQYDLFLLQHPKQLKCYGVFISHVSFTFIKEHFGAGCISKYKEKFEYFRVRSFINRNKALKHNINWGFGRRPFKRSVWYSASTHHILTLSVKEQDMQRLRNSRRPKTRKRTTARADSPANRWSRKSQSSGHRGSSTLRPSNQGCGGLWCPVGPL